MLTFIHFNGCLLVYLMCPLASWNTPSSLEGDEGRWHPCCGWELHPHENSKSNSFFISAQTKIVPSLSLALSEYKKAGPQSDLYYLDSFRHLLLHKITPQQWLETITITYLAYKSRGQLGSARPFSLEVFHTVAAHLWLELRSDWGHLESFCLKFSAWAGEIQTPACWNSWGSSGISPPLLPLSPPLPFPPSPPPSLSRLPLLTWWLKAQRESRWELNLLWGPHQSHSCLLYSGRLSPGTGSVRGEERDSTSWYGAHKVLRGSHTGRETILWISVQMAVCPQTCMAHSHTPTHTRSHTINRIRDWWCSQIPWGSSWNAS